MTIAIRPVFGFAFVGVIENGVDFVELDLSGATISLGAILIEMRQRFIRRTKPSEIPATSEEDDLICQHDVLRGVCNEDDRASLIGEAAHQLHQRGFSSWVQARGWLVEEEKPRFGDQLHANRDALLLSATQAADLHILAMGEVQICQHFHHTFVAFFGGCISGHAQLRGIIQCLIDRQLHVDDVFLRHETNVVTDRIKVRINVDVVDQNARRRRGRTIPRHRIDEGRFSAAALSDDDDKFTRLERH